VSQFIQLHLLTAYPPSNLNRDDLGRPKTALVGGTERLRVSSQSLKRAWRESDLFEDAMGEWKGIRTKRFGNDVYNHLITKGVKEKDAEKWAEKIVSKFGKVEAHKTFKAYMSQLVHIAPEEQQAAVALADLVAAENREPTDKEVELLRQRPKAVDIAMFGRMLADSPDKNVEAAVQVAHAITVNPVKIEDDFFTAVDDLNKHDEDAGAGHMGEAGFGSGIFYLYLCINKTQLMDNLQDEALVNQAIQALVETAAKVSPTGKQNSFASRAYTSYLLAEKGMQQPRSLSVAFLKAVKGDDPMSAAIGALEMQRERFDAVYGACADAQHSMNAQKGEGSLSAILQFVAE
jgi:CRISPR system Cascade subunit CasC